MKDMIVRATAADGQIRAFAATTRDMVEEARVRHNTSPVATAALGRLMTAAAMMGSMMKGEEDLITLTIKGDGPIGAVVVTADARARVKGYVENPNVLLPANSVGKLDVRGAVGQGYLNVIKDLGLKEPYSGQIELVSGEIAEDLTYYFAASEQVPSAVGLGVLMNKENTVRQAGGFIIQLMPFAQEKIIETLEERLKNVKSVTAMLEEGNTPQQILKLLLGDMDLVFTDEMDTGFHCNCSKERVSKAIVSIGKKDLTELIEEGKEIEVNCHFCNSHYRFTVDELKKLREAALR